MSRYSRRPRPDPFALSFPDEFEARGSDSSRTGERSNASAPPDSRSPSVSSNATSTSLGKRKADVDIDSGTPKRRQLPKAKRYQRPEGRTKEVIENPNLVIHGENDNDELFEDDADDQKPIRVLDDFAIFDPKHGCEMVMLDALERDDGVDRQFEAAGMVSSYYENDEDDGQNDEAPEAQPLRVRLTAILRFTVNYAVETEPFYIETQYAWYILRSPSQAYREHWQHFCTPHRIAQIIISHASQKPSEVYSKFLQRFVSKTLLGRTFVESDIRENVLDIRDIILDEADSTKLLATPFVRHILSEAPSRPATSRPPRRQQTRAKVPLKLALGHDIDLAVLKAENQGPTRVTPRIAKLAAGYFRDEIKVVGSAPPPVNKASLEATRKRARRRLWKLIESTRRLKANIDHNKKHKIKVGEDYYSEVTIDKIPYKIGDIAIVPGDQVAVMPTLESQLDEDAQVHDYFWFARILYFAMENQVAHIQWFNHGSQTFVGELAHPQELFLADQCGDIPLKDIFGKATVHISPNSLPLDKPDDYFCKFTHALNHGAFLSVDHARLDRSCLLSPPDNCPVCSLMELREIEKNPRGLKDDAGSPNGVAFGGKTYHNEDFVLYRAEKGPANIGYITDIDLGTKQPTVTARRVGRVADLDLPAGVLKDERHLYLTDEETTFKIEDLLKVIYAPCIDSVLGPQSTLEDWLNLSYDHFYVKYNFPALKVKNWKDKQRINCEKFNICTECFRGRLQKRKSIHQFLNAQNLKPLRTLDLFGGVGAFSRGLVDGSGALKITHAVEISPSAAKTFSRNSPQTVIFNQCANEMLQYIIKSQQGHSIEVPKQKFDDKTPVQVPPKPGEVDVIVAGFPCQSHSTLNMFRNAQDAKTNLILTTLSYMDYYSPRFGYFENVPGFLRYALNADQVDVHTTRGGVQSGGLKLFVRSLLDMHYQVRIGQLQAGHYGTPQRRVRFFIVAAKEGQVLPDFPEPTHDFPENKTLEIKIRVGDRLHQLLPVRFTDGIAHHSFVSIADSILDLPRFDWKHPQKSRDFTHRTDEESKIPAQDCHSKDGRAYCGFQGQIGYFRPPQTRYQLCARSGPETTDIQQYTRRFDSKKVVQVLNIPLIANADYTSLPRGMHDWQLVDPSSAMGRKNYKPGAYGRTDKDSIFQTTVTNMEPTAKQSRVLHPRDQRMFTVRELARSQGFPDNFVFEALGNKVVTMHRQIGNAVPLQIGHALGRELRESLFQKWNIMRENATVIDSDDEDEGAGNQIQQQHRSKALSVQESDEDGSDMDIY